MFLELIGWLGVTLTATQFIPQVIKSFKTKKLQDISLQTFILIIATATTWLIHSSFNGDIYIFLANALVLISAIIIVVLKIRYK